MCIHTCLACFRIYWGSPCGHQANCNVTVRSSACHPSPPTPIPRTNEMPLVAFVRPFWQFIRMALQPFIHSVALPLSPLLVCSFNSIWMALRVPSRLQHLFSISACPFWLLLFNAYFGSASVTWHFSWLFAFDCNNYNKNITVDGLPFWPTCSHSAAFTAKTSRTLNNDERISLHRAIRV